MFICNNVIDLNFINIYYILYTVKVHLFVSVKDVNITLNCVNGNKIKCKKTSFKYSSSFKY